METRVPSLDQLIDNYLFCWMAEGKSRKTIERYGSNLRRFNEFVKRQQLSRSVSGIGPAEARRFILHLQNDVTRWETSQYINDGKRLSPLSVQSYTRATKAF